MKVRTEFNLNAATTHFRGVAQRGLLAAGMHLMREYKREVGRSATGAAKKARSLRRQFYALNIRRSPGNVAFIKGGGKTLSAKQKTYERYRHSNPGEPPRKITGFGQANIALKNEPGRRAVRVGLWRNALYMFFLDRGVRRGGRGGRTRIAPRPWILTVLRRELDAMRRIAAGASRGGAGSAPATTGAPR